MRLLAASDIHLGRPVSRVPIDAARQCSPRVAFERLIETALEEHADAVLLAGDIADRDNVFLEAYGVLQRGVSRLQREGIPLIAVAGNHDTHILPELADAVNNDDVFKLLGQGGVWDHTDIQCEDGQQVRILGWSFPRSHYGDNPLAGFSGPGAEPPSTVIGLLHAERGAKDGKYAPVPDADLVNAQGVDLWILGHIHSPDTLEGVTKSFYPGSLQALDPTETGLHGAVWITRNNGEIQLKRHVPALLRYERLTLDASGMDGQGELIASLKNAVAELQQQEPSCIALSTRICIEGETSLKPAEIRRALVEEEQAGVIQIDDGFTVYIERVDVDARPPLDLADLATGRDTTAFLARLLQNLESEVQDEAAQNITEEAVKHLRQIDQASAFNILHDQPNEDVRRAEACRLLRQQGYALLRELCKQRETEA